MVEITEENIESVLTAVGGSADYSELIGTYVNLRDQAEELKRAYAASVVGINAVMGRIEGRLLHLFQESGQESAKTAFGTAYTKTGTSAKVDDWNALVGYVKANDAFDLLTKSVAKDAVKSRIDETGEIVPGVSIQTFSTVGVRRAS